MTKLTLELPASAAKRLAALTPQQLKAMSDALGFEVLSATIQPNEAQRRSRANADIYTATTKPMYHTAVPWDAIKECLTRHGFEYQANVCETGSTQDDGRLQTQVGDNTYLLVSWHRMPVTGKYEVVAYVS